MGSFTTAIFQVGLYIYMEDRLSQEFVNFIDQLATFAQQRCGCVLEFQTTNEWIVRGVDAFDPPNTITTTTTAITGTAGTEISMSTSWTH